MADIFLSYKREDRARAQQVEQALRAQGWSVFWDHNLLPGVLYRLALTREIRQASCVLVLWSRASIGSKWVTDEAKRGDDLHKLVAARIEPIDDVDIPLGFGEVQTADLSDWSGDPQADAFQQLVQGIAQLPSVPPPSPASLQPPVLPRPSVVPTPSGGGGIEPPALPPTGTSSRGHVALRPTLLLALVFLLNLVETRLDGWLTPASLGAQAGYPIAEAFRGLEEHLGLRSFASHDATNALAVYGYTFSYFFVFPLVCLFVAWNLARRQDPRPYRALSLAVAIDYAISLPFFVFFPVPERWALFESEAMLLSDKWSDRLIEAIRPMSGLDNSFPSTHVSLMVMAATASLIFAVPFRKCTVPLGATVVLSTFVLGVHWIPDVLCGFALGIVSMLLAWRLTLEDRLAFLWGGARSSGDDRVGSFPRIVEAAS